MIKDGTVAGFAEGNSPFVVLPAGKDHHKVANTPFGEYWLIPYLT